MLPENEKSESQPPCSAAQLRSTRPTRPCTSPSQPNHPLTSQEQLTQPRNRIKSPAAAPPRPVGNNTVPRQHDNNGGQRDDPASSRVKARGEGSGGWDGTHQDGDTCRVPAHCCSLYEGTGAAYSHSRLESPAPGTVRARRAGARPFGAAVAQSMPGMARTYGRPGAAGRGTAGARRGGVVLVVSYHLRQGARSPVHRPGRPGFCSPALTRVHGAVGDPGKHAACSLRSCSGNRPGAPLESDRAGSRRRGISLFHLRSAIRARIII